MPNPTLYMSHCTVLLNVTSQFGFFVLLSLNISLLVAQMAYCDKSYISIHLILVLLASSNTLYMSQSTFLMNVTPQFWICGGLREWDMSNIMHGNPNLHNVFYLLITTTIDTFGHFKIKWIIYLHICLNVEYCEDWLGIK